MKVAIIKYNAGNVRSVKNAFERLGVESIVTDDPAVLLSAERIVFPGVGEASSAMEHLTERGLDRIVKDLKQPVLAICLGMQLLCAKSEENDTECLGLLPYIVRRFASDDLTVPHMGWNNIAELRSPLFDGISERERMYFVHSYYVEHNDNTTAAAEYGIKFSAAVSTGNFYAVQFHPEKSGEAGSRILKNFLEL